jgi:hypothetical protein
MKLPGDYVSGFIDGEGCFTIVISKHKTKKLGLDARIHFQIEVRADDLDIIEDIQETLECGRIYYLSYERYGWNPHVELKVSSLSCSVPSVGQDTGKPCVRSGEKCTASDGTTISEHCPSSQRN